MPPPKATVVHFTEAFLREASNVLNENELRAIVDQLTSDREAGAPVSGAPHLRRLELNSVSSPGVWHVWYLDFPETPHVEVVGLSLSETGRTSELSKTTMLRMVRIAIYLRAFYRAYTWCREHLENLL